MVKQKWHAASQAAQSTVKDLLSMTEKPVITASGDSKRRIESQVTLGSLNRRFANLQVFRFLTQVPSFVKRLPRMPFPTDTKDWHFDYESILRSNVGPKRRHQDSAKVNHSIAWNSNWSPLCMVLL